MKLAIAGFSNLQQRIIIGILGGAFMIGSIYYNQWTYFLLFMLICFIALKEFYDLIGTAQAKPNRNYGLFTGTLLFTLVFLIEAGIVTHLFYFLFFPILFFLFLIELFEKNEKPFVNIALTFLGNIYIAIPFALLNISAFRNGEYNYRLILGILFLLWSNDIGGYFAGMKFGKTKLFLRVSPKKTWEGAFGGSIFAIITSFILSYFYTDLKMTEWLVLAIIIVVFGSYGDLIESLLKRSLTLKDSAQTLPGHGGFLDRFDGLLIASPFIAAYLRIFC